MQNFKAAGNVHDKRRRFNHYSGPAGQVCKLQIAYRDGGMSFMDYKNRPRGFYLAVTVIGLTTYPTGTTMEQSSPMSDCNFTMHLEEAKRYNDKRLQAIAETWDEFAGHFARHYMVDRPAAVELLQQFVNSGISGYSDEALGVAA